MGLFSFFILFYLQFELFCLDQSVFISVLVVEHVSDDLLHGQAGLYSTFAFFHLQLDELPELKKKKGSTDKKSEVVGL